MPIYEFASEEIRPVSKTTFSLAQLQERRNPPVCTAAILH